MFNRLLSSASRAVLLSVALAAGILPLCTSLVLAQESIQAPLEAAAGPTEQTIEGFRSSRFGMDEAAVRAAIISDFGVDAAAIEVAENIAERTRILSVSAPDVLEGGGTALVSYVLGYKSKALDQVSVLWSPETDESIEGTQLVSNASALQAYFLQSGFNPRDVVTDATVPEGIVVFRGLDEDGHMALLLLRGTAEATEVPVDGAAPAEVPFVPSGLLLAYLANPAEPDVFTVAPGQF